jgi:hypothetical protein
MTNGQKCDVYQVCELIKCCLKRVCMCMCLYMCVCLCVCVCERERVSEWVSDWVREREWVSEWLSEREGGRETDIRPDVCKAAFPWLIYLPYAPIIVLWTSSQFNIRQTVCTNVFTWHVLIFWCVAIFVRHHLFLRSLKWLYLTRLFEDILNG